MMHILLEALARRLPERVPEPALVMDGVEQADAYADQGRMCGFLAPLYLYHAIQASALIRPGDLVLDLACGPGSQLRQMSRMNQEAHFIGVDASLEMLRLAHQQIVLDDCRNIEFSHSLLPDLNGIADASVDVVTCTMALHHLPDVLSLRATFHEIRRVLKPSGRIYIADFGRLKRIQTQRYLAGQRKREQPEIFRLDYYNSLRAAFSVDELASSAFPAFGDQLEVKQTHQVPLFVVLLSRQRTPLLTGQQDCARDTYRMFAPTQRADFHDIARFFWQGGYPLAFRPW